MCKQKKLIALFLAGILTAPMTACGQTEDPSSQADIPAPAESAEAPASTSKKVITQWSWATSQFEQIKQAYLDSHPDANVEIEEVMVAADDYLTKLQQGYASGGDMPDILLGEIAWRKSSFQLGIWENLEAAPYNFDRSVAFDYVIGCTTNNDGQVVGIENAQNPAFMSFKKDLARQYLGTDDVKKLEAMFQSYDDYAKIGQEVYEASGGKVTLFAGLQDVSTMMIMQQRDKSNLNAAGELEVTPKVNGIIDTLEKLRAANACGNLTQWSTEWNAAYGASNNILFPSASWSITFQIEPNDPEGNDNWGMFTPAGGGYGWGGTCHGVCTTSNVKQETWDFIEWSLLTKEGAQISKDSASFFLPVKSLYEDPAYTEGTRPLFGEQQIYKFMMEDIASTIPSASLTVYDKIVMDSMDMIAQLMTADNSVTAEAAKQQFVEDLAAKVPDVPVK